MIGKKFDLALQKAEMYDKVYALPKGADTLMDRNVYKDAVDFSGGEKQKLLLATAMYKDAPILILDEPTAALDPIAEKQLYLKYSELTDGKLSFFISHRLSSTRFCDRILFVSGGQITEMGTHEELMPKRAHITKCFRCKATITENRGWLCMRNFKMICKMYREIAGLDKGILPVDFFCAILTGAKPL